MHLRDIQLPHYFTEEGMLARFHKPLGEATKKKAKGRATRSKIRKPSLLEEIEKAIEEAKRRAENEAS